MQIRLLLWGIGQVYNSVINLLKCYENLGQIEIVGITAQELPDFRTLDGYTLVRKEEIQSLDFDYLLVMSDNFYDEIVSSAVSVADVPRSKIVSYRILKIPGFDFPKYDLVKNQRGGGVSIVSNNCWGGIIYNTLNMECLSPFKNVSIASDDYIKIISNLKHYLSVDPIWTGKTQIDANQNRAVPMLELDDVLIKCNHDLDAGLAIQKWKRRRDKFNWNHMLVEMYTDDSVVERAFGKASEQYDKRICFVPYVSHEGYTVTLPEMYGQTKFYETVNDNAGIGKNAIAYDILEMLCGCVRYRYT